MQLTGLLPVSRDVTAFLDNAEQLGGVSELVCFAFASVLLCAGLPLCAWRNSRDMLRSLCLPEFDR